LLANPADTAPVRFASKLAPTKDRIEHFLTEINMIISSWSNLGA